MSSDAVYIGRNSQQRFGFGLERSEGIIFTASAQAGIEVASLRINAEVTTSSAFGTLTRIPYKMH